MVTSSTQTLAVQKRFFSSTHTFGLSGLQVCEVVPIFFSLPWGSANSTVTMRKGLAPSFFAACAKPALVFATFRNRTSPLGTLSVTGFSPGTVICAWPPVTKTERKSCSYLYIGVASFGASSSKVTVTLRLLRISWRWGTSLYGIGVGA